MPKHIKVTQNPEEELRRLHKRHEHLMTKQVSTEEQIKFLRRCSNHPDIIPQGLRVHTSRQTTLDVTGRRRLKQYLEERQIQLTIRDKKAEKGRREIRIQSIEKDIAWMTGGRKRIWCCEVEETDVYVRKAKQEKSRLMKKFARLKAEGAARIEDRRKKQEEEMLLKREAKSRCEKNDRIQQVIN